VGQETERASWTTLGRQLDRRDRRTQTPHAPVWTRCLNFSATVKRSRLQTISHHLCQLILSAEELLIRFSQSAAVNFEQRAAGSVYRHRKPRAIERDQSGRKTRHDTFAEFLRGVGALAGFGTELLELLPLLLQLRDYGLKRL